MPLLTTTVDCNCSCTTPRPVIVAPVIVTPVIVAPVTLRDTANSPSSDDVEAKIIQVKGSTYNEVYQRNLKLLRADKKMNTDSVEFVIESNNIKDKNAILVRICNLPVGYVDKGNIVAMTKALRGSQIENAKLNTITTYWHQQSCTRNYQATVVVQKQGKWPKPDTNYIYNQHI